MKDRPDVKEGQKRGGKSMAKNRPITMNVHIASPPAEAPVGLLSRCLFGTSIEDLAVEIARNSGGKWDGVYAEG